MHEKIADAFEGLVALVLAVLVLSVVVAGLIMIGNGNGAGMAVIILGLALIVTMFGVLSVFISIRRHLMSIDQQLRNRSM